MGERWMWAAWVSAMFVVGCGDTSEEEPARRGADMSVDVDMSADMDMSADADMEAPWMPPAGWTYEAPDWSVMPEVEELWFEARQVDSGASEEAEMEHGIFVPAGRKRPELFVFLSGSGGRPRNGENILRVAARAGYRTIGLAYPTELSNADACDGSADKDCQEKFRREKLYGEDGLDVLNIKPADAIVVRLVTLLKRLHQQRPQAGFDAYYEGDEPVWELLVLGGFSQGSGHVSYLAMEHKVARLVLFSSGADNIIINEQTEEFEQAPWVLRPRATPAGRHFGILHTEDLFRIKRIAYETFGMARYGDFVNPEEAAAPYGYTHMLLTDATPAMDPNRAHNSLATDAFMPKGADGLPLMKDAHYYMFTAPIPED